MAEQYYNFERYIGAINNIEAQSNVDDAFEALKLYTHSLGATSILFGQVVNPIVEESDVLNFGRTDWPEDFFSSWVDKNAAAYDPVALYARRKPGVFRWQEAYDAAPALGKAVMDRARDYNLKKGVALTVSSGIQPLGILSLGYDENGPSKDELLLLEIVASHAYTHVRNLLGIDNIILDFELTLREHEVMCFAAIGKTDREIAEILSISTKTVGNHMSNIMRKLNANNRTHAVTMSIKTGQIHP